MFSITYYGNLSDKPITEYLPVTHQGMAGDRAIKTFLQIAKKSGVEAQCIESMLVNDGLDESAKIMTGSNPPILLEYRKKGKFVEVINREWR